jgi:hypothetical protein
MGRNKLAIICGYENWRNWKASFDDRDTMFSLALKRLQTPGNNISHHWRALAGRPTALQLLVYPNKVRDRGDVAAHASGKKNITEGVLSLPEVQARGDMTTIFAAVYEETLAR